METRAVLRGVRLSVDKGRLVADLIRGKKVDQALNTLNFTQKKAAGIIKKVLESAIANAENNHALDVDRLVVDTATVGRSIVMKRFHARGRGRASRVEKWFSHITIVVRQKDSEAKAAPAPRRRRPEAKQEAA